MKPRFKTILTKYNAYFKNDINVQIPIKYIKTINQIAFKQLRE